MIRNMAAKCIVHVHITAELTAYQLVYAVMWHLYAVGHTYTVW